MTTHLGQRLKQVKYRRSEEGNRGLTIREACEGMRKEIMTPRRDSFPKRKVTTWVVPVIKMKTQHTCSGAGRMRCKVWKSYFQFSHKGNTLLHILMDSEHVAD